MWRGERQEKEGDDDEYGCFWETSVGLEENSHGSHPASDTSPGKGSISWGKY